MAQQSSYYEYLQIKPPIPSYFPSLIIFHCFS